MVGACTQCGRAYCRRHMDSKVGRCLLCADRCSSRQCEIIASKKCQRCQRMLCINHRTRIRKRCGRCEGDYTKRLVAQGELHQSRERRDAFLSVAKLAVVAFVMAQLGEVHLLFIPVGIGVTWLVARRVLSPPQPLQIREREKFLAECLLPESADT